MNFANISKLKNHREKRFALFLLIFIFTLMAGFSSGLHNHEFDLDGPHKDCFPCQYTHISADLNDFSSDIGFNPVLKNCQIKLILVYVVNLSWTLSGLSPPHFS